MPRYHWLHGLLKRHPELCISCFQCIETKLTDAKTKKHVAEHIARIQAAIRTYRKKGLTRIVNVDRSGIYFKNIDG